MNPTEAETSRIAFLKVGNTILDHLGGSSRFQVMTGAKNFQFKKNGVSFNIGRNAGKWTHITITLDNNDTYKMVFFRFLGVKILDELQINGLMNNQIGSVFTERTGMYLNL